MTTYVIQPPLLSKGRLLLLGVSSVILCVSFIMSVFAPFPLALAFILYGRALGFLTGLMGLFLSFGFAYLVHQDLTLMWFYAAVFIFSVGIAEIALRNINPVKGIVGFGIGFVLLFFGTSAAVIKSQNQSVEGFVTQQIRLSMDKLSEQRALFEQSPDKDSIQVLQLLDNPDQLANNLIEVFPGYFFIGVFIMLWFNMFLVLKSRRLLLAAQDYPHSEKDLLEFKVPFGFVLLLIAGLVMAVWGKDLGGVQVESWGMTLIKCLGIFYFFQGFGVFSDLLNFLGIMGFFRSLIVMLVIFTANYLIAVAGLFDNWFDFRKYFVKRKTDE